MSDRVAESLASAVAARVLGMAAPVSSLANKPRSCGAWSVFATSPNLDIVREVISSYLDDLFAFAAWAVGRAG